MFSKSLYALLFYNASPSALSREQTQNGTPYSSPAQQTLFKNATARGSQYHAVPRSHPERDRMACQRDVKLKVSFKITLHKIISLAQSSAYCVLRAYPVPFRLIMYTVWTASTLTIQYSTWMAIYYYLAISPFENKNMHATDFMFHVMNVHPRSPDWLLLHIQFECKCNVHTFIQNNWLS